MRNARLHIYMISEIHNTVSVLCISDDMYIYHACENMRDANLALNTRLALYSGLCKSPCTDPWRYLSYYTRLIVFICTSPVMVTSSLKIGYCLLQRKTLRRLKYNRPHRLILALTPLKYNRPTG